MSVPNLSVLLTRTFRKIPGKKKVPVLSAIAFLRYLCTAAVVPTSKCVPGRILFVSVALLLFLPAAINLTNISPVSGTEYHHSVLKSNRPVGYVFLIYTSNNR